MRLINRKALEKLKRKNKGNVLLIQAINQLIKDIESHKWKSQTEIKTIRPDADCVHNDGFYFFNINIHRTMVLIEFEDDEATIVWAGSHKQYEIAFKNNKTTIRKWLKSKNWI
ncbi:MAG: type II toxin-antitoxin system HigB family toxin [Psychroflexus sp.]